MWIDSLIGFVSPRAGFSRLKFREATVAFKKAAEIRNRHTRKYEGAARSRRTVDWRAGSSSANTEIAADLVMLRNRSRDMVRNNAYANRGVRLIGANVVGKGVRANIKAEGRENQEKILNDDWKAWALTTEIDYEGRKNLFGLQREIIEATAESGEVLIRRRSAPDSNFPFKMQVLESDYLASNLFLKSENGNEIFNGLELDDEGRVVAYHLYKKHPGSASITGSMKISFETVRVPADEIAHIFRGDRPNQLRGVPWFAAAMIRLRDFDEYEDAQLVRQKIAACFSVFIGDVEPHDDNLSDDKKEDLGEKVEPGIIEFLPPGKTVHFADPPGVENYKEYANTVLRAVAVGIGCSFEALTGDLSEVNYSSARMGNLEFNRNIEMWRECILNLQFNDRVFSWFLVGERLSGKNVDGATTTWIAPKRELIDPTKEIPARVKAIRAGIESLDDAILQNGKDPEKHYQQIAKTNETLDTLGLILDSDARKVTNVGVAQDTEDIEGKQPSDE